MSRLRFSKLPAKERAKMAAAIRSGERVSEIAKAFGVSRRTVYNHKAQVEEIDLQCRTAVLTVRLNKQDIEDLDKLAERQQLTRAETARRVLLRAVDVFQPEPIEVESFLAVGNELAKIGSNLNQIAHAINLERKSGGLKSIAALEDTLDRMDDWIREVNHAATQIRYKIVLRSKQQKLRNEEVFGLLSERPMNFMKRRSEAIEAQEGLEGVPDAQGSSGAASGPLGAITATEGPQGTLELPLGDAVSPAQKPSLGEKRKNKMAKLRSDLFSKDI